MNRALAKKRLVDGNQLTPPTARHRRRPDGLQRQPGAGRRTVLGSLALLTALAGWGYVSGGSIGLPAADSSEGGSPLDRVAATHSVDDNHLEDPTRREDDSVASQETRSVGPVGTAAQRFSVHSRELGSDHPVEGVAVEVFVAGSAAAMAKVVTDADGVATGDVDAAPPGHAPSYLVHVTHPDLLVLGYPKRLDHIPGELHVKLARAIRVEGRVLDPLGQPLPHALVALGQEPARSSQQDLGARRIAVSDETGAFSVAYPYSFANTSRVFASHHGYPPAFADIDLEELEATGRVFAVLQFVAGADLAVRVIDTQGAPVPGCSISLSTRGDPSSRSSVAAGAPPRDRAEKTLLCLTNQDGVLESQGWPAHAAVRLAVLSERGETRTIVAAWPGPVEPDGTVVVAGSGYRLAPTLQIARIPNVPITGRGTAAGWSEEDRRDLRMLLEDEGSGRWAGAIAWGRDADFEVTFWIRPEQIRPEATYFVTWTGGERRCGPYRIQGAADLGWIDCNR